MPLRCVITAFVLLFAAHVHAQNNYPLTADSQRKENVPHGVVTKYTYKSSGTIFPGTVRDYWVYVPAQYKPGTDAALMVFQDGGGYQSADGQWRVPVVFDNLIADGSMPITIAVMVNPGVVPPENPETQLPRFNRSVEYDSINDDYAMFLAGEFLPVVEKTAGVRFTRNSAMRGVAGSSSGGSCSFTAAWNRPELFGKVFCTIGSFTDLRGAHNYPTLVRKHERKPIRIFMQDGSNDQNIYSGSWWMANQDLALALDWAGYDYKFVTGDGGHDGRQGGQVFPEAMRFLFRDWKNGAKPVTRGFNQRIYQLVSDDDLWEIIPGRDNKTSVTADRNGDIYAYNATIRQITRIDTDLNFFTFAQNVPFSTRIQYGAEDYLYLQDEGNDKMYRYDKSGNKILINDKWDMDHFALFAIGGLYPKPTKSTRKDVIETLKATDNYNGANSAMAFSPDRSLLFIAPLWGRNKNIVSYRVLSDGSLTDKQNYHDLQVNYGEPEVYAVALTNDSNGWLYIATRVGIQVCDQAGRVNCILATPAGLRIKDMAWGGKNREYLWVSTWGGPLFRRKTKVRGINPCDAPVKPPAPRL